MTRRELAIALTAAAPAMAQQPAARLPEDVDTAAGEQVARTRETLRKFRVPIATEPSFVFRP
jgi:hypothetical protein